MLTIPDCPMGKDLYSFTVEPHLPVDYEPLNHYTATNPNSRFLQTVTVQFPGFDQRIIVRNRELVTVTRAGTTIDLLSNDDLLATFEQRFGLQLSDTMKVAIIKKVEALCAEAAIGRLV